ncbi:methyltransferase [Polaribacter porphyrae]|uniref:Methyltransferase n=1 Tax=Polaribacter porphyrae TaxID=1137780 RepID=A0A2S7WP42_9FLAO|nr:methyltransferase [Polaribacter porphyrae]PQJ79354.1 methyltransferase [Polaribacter porphyrae]
MRKFIKKITHPFLRVANKMWLLKPRKYAYKGINVLVHKEVFPPHFTISTKILLDFIDDLNLKEKSLLELGCGTGIISLFAASKGAIVTATDINDKALEFLKKASKKNKIPLTILYSDLFSELNNNYFDFIIINPPYYPKNPKNKKEQAWFCGEGFEYFHQLFKQQSERKKDNHIFMILSEDCDLEAIKNIASFNNFYFQTVLEKTVLKEKNYIFKVLKM